MFFDDDPIAVDVVASEQITGIDGRQRDQPRERVVLAKCCDFICGGIGDGEFVFRFAALNQTIDVDVLGRNEDRRANQAWRVGRLIQVRGVSGVITGGLNWNNAVESTVAVNRIVLQKVGQLSVLDIVFVDAAQFRQIDHDGAAVTGDDLLGPSVNRRVDDDAARTGGKCAKQDVAAQVGDAASATRLRRGYGDVGPRVNRTGLDDKAIVDDDLFFGIPTFATTDLLAVEEHAAGVLRDFDAFQNQIRRRLIDDLDACVTRCDQSSVLTKRS